MSDYAIKAEGIGKRYSLRTFRSFRDTLPLLAEAFANPKDLIDKPGDRRLWAIEDINFELPEGKILSLLGRNGAGKSTLLKVICRVTAPTTGKLRFFGRIGSLLEAGVGFHPELSGRDNIFLSGVILGMTEREIRSRFDEIVEFAEIEDFLDVPVKRYSSGLFVRLGFSVAAHMSQDILLVDEVLAVGDMAFRSKCLARLRSLAREGRTVIFVSHNLSSVSELCDTGLYLEKGKQKFFGPIDAATEKYKTDLAASADSKEICTVGAQTNSYDQRPLVVTKITLESAPTDFTVPFGHPMTVRFQLQGNESLSDLHVFVRFHEFSGRYVASCHCERSLSISKGETSNFALRISNFILGPGTYSLVLSIGRLNANHGILDSAKLHPAFEVVWPESLGAFERDTRGEQPLVIFNQVSLNQIDSEG